MIDKDKQTEYLSDAKTDQDSACCGATLYEGGICSNCKEHSGPAEEEYDDGQGRSYDILDEELI